MPPWRPGSTSARLMKKGTPMSPNSPLVNSGPAWQVGATTIVTFVALLYVIELIDVLSGHRLERNGIRPLEADGLWGIIFAPLLHANWGHLVANTVPALVLGGAPYHINFGAGIEALR